MTSHPVAAAAALDEEGCRGVAAPDGMVETAAEDAAVETVVGIGEAEMMEARVAVVGDLDAAAAAA